MLSVLIGNSAPMRILREDIARVARSSLPLLIQGPTGSGKELVAAAIHAVSARRGQFVAFNVCAIGDAMVEDALFGHVRGAFTGATSDVPGYLAEANGGTILFDEISGLSLQNQAKLLRALETHQFRPIGATRDRVSDFRTIAATNDDISTMVAKSAFRADLAFRLRGSTIRVPSLRERVDDVPLLVRHFLQGITASAWTVSDGAMRLLMRQEWPGNVRELRFVVERALMYAHDGHVSRETVVAALSGGEDPTVNVQHDFARRRLVALLTETEWDTVDAARRLGVHRTTVYRRMTRLGIVTPIDARAEYPAAARENAGAQSDAGTNC